jgi:hypothetical protein
MLAFLMLSSKRWHLGMELNIELSWVKRYIEKKTYRI